jgi:hypothetical protein
MERLDHSSARFSDRFLHFTNFRQELLTDGLKSIWRPFREHIDCGTVDNRWEISDPVSKRASNRRETKDDMKASFATLLEESKELSHRSGWASLKFFSSSSYKLAHICLFIRWEDVRDLTSVQNVVDILHEGLHFDLGVGEQESGGIGTLTSLSHENLEILTPLLHSVVLFDFNLEDVEVTHATGQSSQGLSTRTSDTDE